MLRLQYLRKGHNYAGLNERSIEIPLAIEFIKDFPDFIEVGAVLGYYIKHDNIVVDLTDPLATVKQDANTFDFKDKPILSISTVEHFGFGDFGPKDPTAVRRFFQKLKKDFLITVPLGYNSLLDKEVFSLPENLVSFYARYSAQNLWRKVDRDFAVTCKYGSPFLWANCIAVITDIDKYKHCIWNTYLPTKHVNTTPCIVVANKRVGGTLLCNCLNNHPDVQFSLGEPLNAESPDQTVVGLSPEQAFLYNISQYHFKVSGLKITYEQMFPWVYEKITEYGIKVIHIGRRNVVNSALSLILQNMQLSGSIIRPTHNYSTQDFSYKVTIPTRGLLEICKQYQKVFDIMEEGLAKYQKLTIFYEDLTDNQDVSFLSEKESYKICNFLEIEERVLENPRLHKLNKNLKEVLSNWDDVESIIKKSEFKKFLN